MFCKPISHAGVGWCGDWSPAAAGGFKNVLSQRRVEYADRWVDVVVIETRPGGDELRKRYEERNPLKLRGARPTLPALLITLVC